MSAPSLHRESTDSLIHVGAAGVFPFINCMTACTATHIVHEHIIMFLVVRVQVCIYALFMMCVHIMVTASTDEPEINKVPKRRTKRTPSQSC